MKKMFEISIKLATEEHSTAIWEWRNDETARAMSLNQDFISWENHQNWYERILINKNRHIYVGYIEEILFGMVRFEYFKSTFTCLSGVVPIFANISKVLLNIRARVVNI